MKRRQTLEYNWELGTEKIALEVAEYMNGNGLYIGMLSKEGRVWESFGDLTVNLPFAPAEANEAYISHDFSEDKIAFIEKHRLGKVLPETASSGFCVFRKVAFDMERLRELDPKGVDKFLMNHPELQSRKRPKDRKRTQMER